MISTPRVAGVVASLIAALVPVAARAQSFAIVDHETLGDLSPRSSVQALQKTTASPAPDLSFVAFGTRFDLVLEQNDRLAASLPAADRDAISGVEVLEGRLADNDASWVRLVRSPNRVVGLIWDGAEIYAIEPARDVAMHLVAPSTDPDSLIIYRGSDVRGAFGDLLPAWQGTTTATSVLVAEAAAQAAAVFDPAKQIDVGIVGDFEFVDAHPDSANARVIEIMNNVDAIFARQVGVYLSVAAVELFQDDSDPFTTNDAAGLLDELQSHKETTPNLRDKGLTHLFTYRDLAEPSNSTSNVLGVAVFGSVCDVRTSVGLTQADRGTLVNSLIAAHEIAHNFGAPHDAEPTSACASTPASFLMAPNINNSGELSACSIEQMRPKLLGAACLSDLPLADMAVTRASQSPNPLELRLGSGGALTASIVNSAGADALAVDLDVEATGVQVTRLLLFKNNASTDTYEFTCSLEEQRCHIPRLPAGMGLSLFAELAAPAAGPATLTFTARAANDANRSNDAYRFDIDVIPAVDVRLENGKLTPRKLRPLDSAVLTFDLVNHSTVAATNTVVTVNLTNDLEMVDAQRDGCALLPSGLWSCAAGTITRLEPKKLAIEVRARATARFSQVMFLSWASTEPNLDSGSTVFAVDIVEKLADIALSMTLPTVVEPGASVQLKAVIENLGPDAAEAFEFSYSNNEGILIQSITANVGDCRVVGVSGASCTVSAFAVREPLIVTMTATGSLTLRGYLQNAGARASTPDPDDSNNLVDNRFQVGTPPPPPSPPASPPSPPTSSGGGTASGGGGGGGAIDPLLLCACLAVLALQRAEKRARARSSPTA